MLKGFTTAVIIISIVVFTAGCKSKSSSSHKDPVYFASSGGPVSLGSTLTLDTKMVEIHDQISVFGGVMTYNFDLGLAAKVRVSVYTMPGARDISAYLWNANGWGLIGPIDEWQSDWSVILEGALYSGSYDIVVIPTEDTAGDIIVRAEVLEAIPEGF